MFSVNFCTYLQRTDDFKQAFISSAGVDRGMTGNVCQKSPDSNIKAPPKSCGLPRKSCIVRLNASSDFLFAVVHSSHKIFDVNRRTFAIAEFLEILQVGVSITCTFNGYFNVEYAVRPPSNNVATIR